jgi:hypothetical protein
MAWYYRDLWVPSHGRYHRMWNERHLETAADAARAIRDLRSMAPHGIARMWRWSGTAWARTV